jgi:hypothetical protein
LRNYIHFIPFSTTPGGAAAFAPPWFVSSVCHEPGRGYTFEQKRPDSPDSDISSFLINIASDLRHYLG